MIIDVRCVMCKSSVQEDVKDLLVVCGEYERYRRVRVDEVSRIVEVGEWLKEYERVCKEGKAALLLGKGVVGVRL